MRVVARNKTRGRQRKCANWHRGSGANSRDARNKEAKMRTFMDWLLWLLTIVAFTLCCGIASKLLDVDMAIFIAGGALGLALMAVMDNRRSK